MKNNIKTIIFVILILFIILAIIIKKNNSNNNSVTNNSTTSINTAKDKYQSNFNGENAVIYLGTHSQYEPITIVLDKSLSDEEITKNIISKISELIGYKIEINSIKFEEKNIYIDFSSNYAPFNIEESNETDDSNRPLYTIYGNENITYTIFSSIYKSLNSYFGTDYNIYFSVNAEDINISKDNFTLSIDSSKPYVLDE